MDSQGIALLVIDLQNDYVHRQGMLHRLGYFRAPDEPGFGALIVRAKHLIEQMKTIGWPVIWVKTELRQDHLDSALPITIRENKDFAPETGFLTEDSWGSKIIDDLQPSRLDFVIVKKGNSAFQFTYLDRLLSNLGIDTCVVVGGDVSGALADSVRQGCALGYEMIVAADATFPADSPYLRNLWNRAELKTTEEIVATLSPKTTPRYIESRTALVVVDLQNDFVHPDGYKHRVDQGRLSDEQRKLIIQSNQRLLEVMREKGNPVIFVTTYYRRDMVDSASPPIDRKIKPIPEGEAFLTEGSWGAQLVDGLKIHEGDFVITKKGRSAFSSTALHRIFRNLGVSRCIITGGAVHGCLEDTIREGAGLGYRFTLVTDAIYQPNSPTIAGITGYAELKLAHEVVSGL